MPRASQHILSTDREVRHARAGDKRAEFRIKDAPGLVLRVTPKGKKTWVFLYRCPQSNNRRKASLGTYPDTALAAARAAVLIARSAVQNGQDPNSSRGPHQSSVTFRELAKLYISEHAKKRMRGDVVSRTTIEAQRMLDTDILPSIGDLYADAVTKRNVLDTVQVVFDRGAHVARDRVLGLIRAIYNWGQETDRLDRNPTTGLKKLNASRPRERVLADHEIRALISYLSRMDRRSTEIRDALHLQLHLGLRTSEITQAPKSEIDLANKLWTIPAHRTKSNRKHVIPLPPQAASILREALERTPKSEWLLPSRYGRDKPIDPHSTTKAMHRICDQTGMERAGTHDLRRTASTGMGGLGVPDEVIERILNHAPRTVVRRHYNHARREKEMRAALETWASHLDEIKDAKSPADTPHLRTHHPA